MQRDVMDKRKEIREHEHLVRPPRLEGKVRNARLSPTKHPKPKRPKSVGHAKGKMH